MKSDEGVSFWSAKKKPPTPTFFDNCNSGHLDFLESAANLRARIFGIDGGQAFRDREALVAMLEGCAVDDSAFVPSDDVRIAKDDKEAAAMKKEAEEGGGAAGVDVAAECAKL